MKMKLVGHCESLLVIKGPRMQSTGHFLILTLGYTIYVIILSNMTIQCNNNSNVITYFYYKETYKNKPNKKCFHLLW